VIAGGATATAAACCEAAMTEATEAAEAFEAERKASPESGVSHVIGHSKERAGFTLRSVEHQIVHLTSLDEWACEGPRCKNE